ncbi:hypothetical protein ACFE04_019986 [Oxalis oulophora]
MAFSSMIRRACSTVVVPIAIRAVGSPRGYHRAAMISSIVQNSRQLRISTRLFSTSSDESLIRTLESEIECAEQPNHKILQHKPESFPFEIQDNQGERTILLTRKYGDEIIEAEVDVPIISPLEDSDDEAEEGEKAENKKEEKEEEEGEDSSIRILVTVSKGSVGPRLEFGLTAFPDEIAIDSFSIKPSDDSDDQLVYEGPNFSDLDESLQNALRKYLADRGINTSTAAFLLEYMTNKDMKEYVVWLENLKNFIKK